MQSSARDEDQTKWDYCVGEAVSMLLYFMWSTNKTNYQN